jgi:hypothetical protein
MSARNKQPQTVPDLAAYILHELEKGYLPPYGEEEEMLVRNILREFLKRREGGRIK